MERKIEIYQGSVVSEDCETYAEQCIRELNNAYRVYITRCKIANEDYIPKNGSTGETEEYL